MPPIAAFTQAPVATLDEALRLFQSGKMTRAAIVAQFGTPAKPEAESTQTPSPSVPVAPALPESVRNDVEAEAATRGIAFDVALAELVRRGIEAVKAANAPPAGPAPLVVHLPPEEFSLPLPRTVRKIVERRNVVRLPTQDAFMGAAGNVISCFDKYPVVCKPLVFESGSFGWKFADTIPVTLPGVSEYTRVDAFLTVSVVIKGSKRGKQADPLGMNASMRRAEETIKNRENK